MKKILVKVKAEDELPKNTGYFKTSYGEKFFNLKAGKFSGIEGNAIGYWVKELEVSDDVYDMIVGGESKRDVIKDYEQWRIKQPTCNCPECGGGYPNIDEYLNKKEG